MPGRRGLGRQAPPAHHTRRGLERQGHGLLRRCGLDRAGFRSGRRHVAALSLRREGAHEDEDDGAGDALAPHLQRAVDVILDARRRDDAVLAAATQFDAFVAAALKAAQNCDGVVVEVGLGGRRDSTNFLQAPITALVSAESRAHGGARRPLEDDAEKEAFDEGRRAGARRFEQGAARKGVEIALQTRRHAAGATAGEDRAMEGSRRGL